MKTAIMGILVVSLLAGCAVKQKPLYYWDGYSSSLYKLKKNPGEEALAEHMEVLEGIIQESGTRGLKVPPGVYAEYGYYLLTIGKTKDAINYFTKEKETYPESTHFMERLIEFAKNESEGSS